MQRYQTVMAAAQPLGMGMAFVRVGRHNNNINIILIIRIIIINLVNWKPGAPTCCHIFATCQMCLHPRQFVPVNADVACEGSTGGRREIASLPQVEVG
jgi:hypothetical protein